MRTLPSYTKIAYLMTALLLVIVGLSVCALFARPNVSSATACIYKDGELLCEFDLGAISEPETVRIEGSDGEYNVICVKYGSIGIIDAGCPHKYCVKQGMSDGSLLPIICLPNRLVIEIRNDQTSADAITY